MAEFKKHGLDVKFKKEIEEWKKYKREKEYDIKLEEEMKEMIELYEKDYEKDKVLWIIPELEEIVWDILPHTNHN